MPGWSLELVWCALFFLAKSNLVYLFLALLGLRAAWALLCRAERRLLSSCGGGPLIEVAFLGVEHKLLFATHRLLSPGSVTVALGLSRSAACGVFLDQGSDPRLLHWQMDSYH